MSTDGLTPMPSVEPEPEKEKKRRGGIFLILLSVLLIGGGVYLGVRSMVVPPVPTPSNGAPTLKDMKGNLVVPDDPSATSPEFMEKAQMVVDTGGDGFQIPILDINVPLGAVNAVNGVMNPPNFQNAFWVRNMGVSLDNAGSGTVYVVAHSTRYGVAPGNLVQKAEQVLLKPGDPIKVDNRTYRFVSSMTMPQGELGSYTDLWDETKPNRLVFVTCLLRNDGAAPTDNLVLIGELME